MIPPYDWRTQATSGYQATRRLSAVLLAMSSSSATFELSSSPGETTHTGDTSAAEASSTSEPLQLAPAQTAGMPTSSDAGSLSSSAELTSRAEAAQAAPPSLQPGASPGSTVGGVAQRSLPPSASAPAAVPSSLPPGVPPGCIEEAGAAGQRASAGRLRLFYPEALKRASGSSTRAPP